MKHFLLCVAVILSSITLAMGQNGGEPLMSVKSFSVLTDDLTARVSAPEKDQNGEVCALIKIETTHTGFGFDVGLMGVTKTVQKAGEIWVYVPKKINRITLSHSQLGVLRNYYFPVPIESATTYLMELTTGSVTTIIQEDTGSQYFAVSYSPKDVNVELYVDDTYSTTGSNGALSVMLPYGKHTYRIEAPRYRSSAGAITIEQSNRTDIDVTLVPSYGFLHFESTPENGIDVYIDDKLVGTTPFTSEAISEGEYSLRTINKFYAPLRKSIKVTGGGETQNISLDLTANFADVTLGCASSEAQIYVNDELISGSVRLSPGIYKVEARRAGHRTTIRSIEVAAGVAQDISLDAPIAITGKLNINSNIVGAEVFVDGVSIGTAPNIFSGVLVGEHAIELRKDGYTPFKSTVTIKEGAISDLNGTLSNAGSLTVDCPIDGASVYLNDALVGVTPLKLDNLSSGEYTVVIKAEGYEDSSNAVSMNTGDNRTIYTTLRVLARAFTSADYKAMGSPEHLVIPDGYTSINEWLLAYNKTIKSVVMPNSITKIGNRAFLNCEALESVKLSDNLTTIDDGAFDGCKALKAIVIPDGITVLSESLFYKCTSLISVTLPRNLTTICKSAFSNCEALPSISIPSSVTTIENDAFFFCEALTSVSIPYGITSIGSQTFYNCMSLKSVTIPSTVTSIGEGAFRSCETMQSITLPNGLKTIGKKAFECCYLLLSITIPSGVTVIEDNAFSSCKALKSVTLSSNTTSIGVEAFSFCESLTTITLPRSVRTVGTEAFYFCDALTIKVASSSPVLSGLQEEYDFRYPMVVTY